MGASYPGKNPHTGQPQGALTAFPPGSNGGVHRGPDLSIRRNVMEGLFMRAMIRDGVLIVVDAKGKRRHRAKVPMAMAENFVTRLQLIVLQGSDANVIRLAAVSNDIFKPPKNGVNGNGGPFAATFHRPPPAAPPAEGGRQCRHQSLARCWAPTARSTWRPDDTSAGPR